MELILYCEICGKLLGADDVPNDTPPDQQTAISHTGQRCDNPDCINAPPLTEGGNVS